MSVTNNEAPPLGLKWAPAVFFVFGVFFVWWSIRLYVAAKCAEGGMLIFLGPQADFPFSGNTGIGIIDQFLAGISINMIAYAGMGCMITSMIAAIHIWLGEILKVFGSRKLTFLRATMYYIVPTVLVMGGGAYLIASMLNCG